MIPSGTNELTSLLLQSGWVGGAMMLVTLPIMQWRSRRSAQQTVAFLRILAFTLLVLPPVLMMAHEPVWSVANLSTPLTSIAASANRTTNSAKPEGQLTRETKRSESSAVADPATILASSEKSFVPVTVESSPQESLKKSPDEFTTQPFLAGAWLLSLYGTVVLVLLGWDLRRYLITWRWSSTCRRTPPDWAMGAIDELASEMNLTSEQLSQFFWTHPDLISPINIGVIQSRIVLPTAMPEWTHQQIKMVLRHEWQHLDGRDLRWCLVWDWVRAMYWCLPPTWWLHRVHREQLEWFCDDTVTQANDDHEAYAETLVDVARLLLANQDSSRAIGKGSLPMVNQSDLKERIRRILDRNNQHLFASRWVALTMAFTILATAVASAATRPFAVRPSESRSIEPETSAPIPAVGRVVALEVLNQSQLTNHVSRLQRTPTHRNVFLATSPDMTNRLLLLQKQGSLDPSQAIIGMGVSEIVADAMGRNQLTGVLSHQPHGFGYRAVESLCNQTENWVYHDRATRFSIPTRRFSRDRPTELQRSLAELRQPGRTRYSSLDTSSKALKRIRLQLPSDSPWWQLIRAGCQEAADQFEVPLTVEIKSRQAVSTPRFAPWSGPVLHVQYDKTQSLGTVTVCDQTDMTTNGLWMTSSPIRIAKETTALVAGHLQNTTPNDIASALPVRLWILHSQAESPTIGRLVERLDRSFPSFP